ncbi:MAG: DEAD/DEAH box helicase [Fimbriiglobus sp.]
MQSLAPPADDTWPAPDLETDAESTSDVTSADFLPTFTDPVPTVVRYADMKLIRPLADAINHAGYTTCTPVQAAVIPKAMRGTDVIGQAQTGTGKTAAFLIPFLNRWRPHTTKGPVGLVMCPTRELALQVATEAVKLAPSKRFRTVAVYGGTGMQKQLDGLTRGCDLVVGTPGRMLDHLRRGSMTLGHIKYVVLDEADRMLDIGFRPDIEKILRRCPDERQTLLMSATVPDTIKRLVNRYLKNPVHLNMSPAVLTVDKIQQSYITVDSDRKFDLLLKVFERENPAQCLIFVERKRSADKLWRHLKGVIPGVEAIHGDLAQSQRERIMANYRTGKVRVLIATDVASRGIDVSGISHVINFDLPMDIENYVHRIGRTGRIGREGVAISFVTPEQSGHLTDIEMVINKLIAEDRVDGFEAYTSRRRAPRTEAEVVARGSASAAPAAVALEAEEPTGPKKAVFGKRVKRYSSRL